MITFFTVPKAFDGVIGINQENAIRSWRLLKPKPEIILFGDDPGVARAAKRLKVRHVPKIARNEYGTPLLDDIFRTADKVAKNDIVCYVNADIIFISDFVERVARLPFRQFLVVGQRFDMRVDRPLDFTDPLWRKKLYQELVGKGSFLTMGIDYFIYRRGLYREMPPFAIGRGFWDSWLVLEALTKRVPVIDATQSIPAIHENHDYKHLKSSPTGKYWKGIEAERNLNYSGFRDIKPPNFYDARYLLTPKGLKPANDLIHLGQRLYHFSAKHSILLPLTLSLKLARKLGPLVHRLKRPKASFTQ